MSRENFAEATLEELEIFERSLPKMRGQNLTDFWEWAATDKWPSITARSWANFWEAHRYA